MKHLGYKKIGEFYSPESLAEDGKYFFSVSIICTIFSICHNTLKSRLKKIGMKHSRTFHYCEDNLFDLWKTFIHDKGKENSFFSTRKGKLIFKYVKFSEKEKYKIIQIRGLYNLVRFKGEVYLIDIPKETNLLAGLADSQIEVTEPKLLYPEELHCGECKQPLGKNDSIVCRKCIQNVNKIVHCVFCEKPLHYFGEKREKCNCDGVKTDYKKQRKESFLAKYERLCKEYELVINCEYTEVLFIDEHKEDIEQHHRFTELQDSI